MIGKNGYYLSNYPRKYDEKRTLKLKYKRHKIYTVSDKVMTDCKADLPDVNPIYKRMKIGHSLDDDNFIWHEIESIKQLIDKMEE